MAAGYGLAFIYGLFAAGNLDINFLSLNGADNARTWSAPSLGWPSPSGRRSGPPAAASPTGAPDLPNYGG